MPKNTPHWVVHDLRRTAASGMAALGYQPHIIERVLEPHLRRPRWTCGSVPEAPVRGRTQASAESLGRLCCKNCYALGDELHALRHCDVCLISFAAPAIAQSPAVGHVWVDMAVSDDQCLSSAETLLRRGGYNRIERTNDSVYGTPDNKIQIVIRCAAEKKFAFFIAAGGREDKPVVALVIKLKKDFETSLPPPPQQFLMFFDFEKPDLAPDLIKYLAPAERR